MITYLFYRLKLIIETVRFVRDNITFKIHSDDDNLLFLELQETNGNFWAVLRLRRNYRDNKLKIHITK